MDGIVVGSGYAFVVARTDRLDPTLWRFKWRWLLGREASADQRLMSECSTLYSDNYGTWGKRGSRPGQPIRQTAANIISHLDADDTWLAAAYHGERLIGYCIALRFQSDAGKVAWVSQLVVDESYRLSRVATTLLYSIWQFSDCYAWGLVTPNPFAVRALETATRRRCVRRLVIERGPRLLGEIAKRVSYIPAQLADYGAEPRPVVDTRFFISHDGLEDMVKAASQASKRWTLGEIDEGEEWVACTFSDQNPDELEAERLTQLMAGADRIWIQAYEGMTLDARHAWHQHTASEVDWLVEHCGITPGARVLDVGGGDGRHSIELARRGFSVTLSDISDRLLALAATEIEAAGLEGVSVVEGDAREWLPEGPFDLVICLYDVLGSSANRDDDLRILKNVRPVVVPGGFFVGSVMNADSVLGRITPDHQPTNTAAFVGALEALAPSRTMEQTGSVFDPRFLLYFDGVFYRKEQFESATWRLPVELVVRDARYTTQELTKDVTAAGFAVKLLNPVQSGRWDREPALDPMDQRAKELLVLAIRPED